MWIYAKTFDVKYVRVRALLTTNVNDVQGWSFGLRHDPSALRACGGAMTVQLVTTTGTHTQAVQGGGQPDFNATQKQGSYAFTQAVVIDFDGALNLPSTVNFVAAGACYLLFAPSQSGSYQVALNVTSDVGSPPVDACGVWEGKSIQACGRSFTFNISCQPTYPPGSGYCSSSGPWIIAGDNTPGPASWIPSFPLSSALTPPFFCGHLNEDHRLNLADPVFLLNFLFLGGPAPSTHRVDVPVLKQTGQRFCYSNNDVNDDHVCNSSCDCEAPPPERQVPRPPCPAAPNPNAAFCGQDGYYLAGLPREYEDRGTTVRDLVTDLEWEKAPGTELFPWYGALHFANDADMALQDDWRLPNVFEALSVSNYGEWEPAVDPVFDFSAHLAESPISLRFWTSSPWVNDLDQRWRLNHVEGHLATNAFDEERKVWLVRGGFSPGVEENAHVGPFPARGFPVEPLHLADADNDLQVNLTDAIFLLNYLFLGGPAPCYIPNRVLRTGITRCYDPAPPHSAVACDSPEPPGSTGGEDGWYATMTPLGLERRFEVSGGTVSDRITGLEWLRDPALVLSALAGTDRLDWEAALSFCETLVFEGHGDWRLPNVNELASLLHFGRENLPDGTPLPKVHDPFLVPDPVLACQVVVSPQPQVLRDVVIIGFWTSTTSTRPMPDGTNPIGRSQAFVVDFLEGRIHNDELCNDKNGVTSPELFDGLHFVWPVRGGLTD
jgi:hypothetical protein